MEQISDLFKAQIGKRVEVSPEEQAGYDKKAAEEQVEWEREKHFILHPEASIYHRIFEGQYKLFQHCSLDNSPHGKQIKKWLEEGKGVYLWGDVGVGKTYLSLSCLKWQLERKQAGYIWTVSELLDNLRYFIALKEPKALDAQINKYCSMPMLILDDFGVQNTTAWADEQLYEVINRRWLKKDELIIIVTSNHAPDELERRVKDEIVGARIMSRVMGMCKVLHIEGKDRRLTKCP